MYIFILQLTHDQKNGKVTHRSIGYNEHADTTELIGYLFAVVRNQSRSRPTQPS